jgi:hypothetical protein
MQVRKVVTGHDAKGRAVIARDEQIDGVPIPGLGELDDGVELLLSPGDVVMQNGTRHRWRVVGGVPATVAAFIIGAHRR